MSNALSENWQYTTICIEDDLGQIVGSGVLLSDTATEKDEYGGQWSSWEPQGRVYLATAKHVLGANESEIAATHHYFLRYNISAQGGLTAARAEFVVRDQPRNWAVHPDPGVDIAVLDVTEWFSSLVDARLRVCPFSEVANPMSLLQLECEAGDDIIVLGYPLRLRQGSTNLPIFRKGILATSPSRAIEDDGQPLRGFLVDGALMPGSSGSPVVSLSTAFIRGDMAVTPHRTLLLGIVTHEWTRGDLARFATSHRSDSSPGGAYANLGFAHNASTVVETVTQLGHHTAKDFLRLDHHLHWTPALGIAEGALELQGTEVDLDKAHRILLRLHRDRMRDLGFYVRPDDYSDIPEVLGAVREQTPPSDPWSTHVDLPAELAKRRGR